MLSIIISSMLIQWGMEFMNTGKWLFLLLLNSPRIQSWTNRIILYNRTTYLPIWAVKQNKKTIQLCCILYGFLFLLEFCSGQQAELLLPLLAQKPNGLTEIKFKFIQIYGPRSILSTSYFYRFSTTLYCYFQKFLQNRPKIITLKLF